LTVYLKIVDRKKYFLEIYKKAIKKYGSYSKRLAAEGWNSNWKTLIAIMMSAQSRDETTILIAKTLFKKYSTLNSLAKANVSDVKNIFGSLNYNNTKAKNVVNTSRIILKRYKGKVPNNLERLMELPGVGRKTANLVLSEIYGKDAICIDTHCHRISNVLGLVKTKTPYETELELQKIAPKKYWNKINRLFVLWGKEVSGRDKNKLINHLKK